MAARKRCRYHWHSSNMAMSSGRLVMSIISPRTERGADFYPSAIWGSPPCTGTYYTHHQAPRAQRHIWTVPVVRTSSTEPGGLALLARDAPVNSWFREIHVSQARRLHWATELDFREKNRACFEPIEARVCCQSPTLPLYYEVKMMKTIFPQNNVYVLRTTTTRHMISFIHFYFHFLAHFQA